MNNNDDINAVEQSYIFDQESSNELELKLTNFSGPLDLLLTLVKQNEIEIKDIFVSQVTEQFLQYMSQLSDLDVDKASEYMATAATLLEIKSRALLPVLPGLDDEDSPEKVFIRQLEEYKMFKEVCGELKEHESVDRYYREPDKNVGEAVEVVKEHLSIEGFLQAFNKFLMKMQLKASSENISRAIVKETFSVPEKMRFLRDYLQEHETVSFFNIFNETTSRVEIITTFSAMLELLKLQAISVKQDELFGDIILSRIEGAQLSEEAFNESVE
ncbi:MAG: segregation/condensation protein A [Corallococcus sp.]|nr:segregation/condensation protein A [Corallococcus sp.]